MDLVSDSNLQYNAIQNYNKKKVYFDNNRLLCEDNK